MQDRACAGESDGTFLQVDAGGTLEELYQSIVSVDFQNTAETLLAAGQGDFTQFIVSDVLNVLDQHQRAGDL